jgi:hypothetical protein
MPSLPCVVASSPVDSKSFGPHAPRSSHFYLVHPHDITTPNGRQGGQRSFWGDGLPAKYVLTRIERSHTKGRMPLVYVFAASKMEAQPVKGLGDWLIGPSTHWTTEH